ncbi:hypothetical protein QYZ43_25650 [Vibrio parahaemolyticus]|nr:hypothetical protein [Vibrio parahaemolyticus]MDN4722849.1 hypothetical protein [Vibrio parahaemolyticus]
MNECKTDGTGSYHWTPTITDHNDPVQEKTWQLSDLDDLNTSDPEVRAYLKRATENGFAKSASTDSVSIR